MAHSLLLRPLHQHRPSQPRTGRRSRRPGRRAALALLAGVLAIGGTLAACGGGDDDTERTPPADSQATAKTAAELAPNLSGSGFTTAESGKVPGSTQNQDTFFAIYQQAAGGKVQMVRVEINLHPDAAQATTQYTALAEALRNIPPDLFGSAAVQTDSAVAYQADQSRSYKTTKADAQGNLVFSDIHRAGRAVVIIYSIGPDSADTANLRKQVAGSIAAKAPR